MSAGAWAHDIGAPEPGCVLLATGRDAGPTGRAAATSAQAVILVLDHERDAGTTGVILNRPIGLLAGELQYTFGDARPIYFGGEVGGGERRALHRLADVPGARRVTEGVYASTADAAAAYVDAGLAPASAFKFVVNCVKWGPGALDAEVDSGKWWLTATSAELVAATRDHAVRRPDADPEDEGGRGVVISPKAQPLWCELGLLCGGARARAASAELRRDAAKAWQALVASVADESTTTRAIEHVALGSSVVRAGAPRGACARRSSSATASPRPTTTTRPRRPRPPTSTAARGTRRRSPPSARRGQLGELAARARTLRWTARERARAGLTRWSVGMRSRRSSRRCPGRRCA